MAGALVLVVAAVVLAARHPGLQLPLAIVAGSAAVLGAIAVLLRALTRALPDSDGEGSEPSA